MNIRQRAVELSAARLAAYLQGRQESFEKENAPKQEELRAAYEQVVQADDFQSAYQAFVNQYGEEAFHRQVTLHLRRS